MNARTLTISVSPQARASYLALFSIGRRAFSAALPHQTQYHRSDFTGQGFTGFYEPDQPTRGPLGGASNVGASQITPRVLRQYLDQFVVGQERAKVVLSVAIHEHYLRVRELQRQKDEEMRLEAQAQRKAAMSRHPVEDEFPGQQPTMEVHPAHTQPYSDPPPSSSLEAPILDDAGPLQIEKSNVLILGPTGVGKTLMCKTLAKVLGVPISMSDCTTFTQAGYIGEDAEQCVHRLFAAAGQDIEAAEHGIIVLDEIDKIATAKVSHGKDVSGEGVQQALLKIIEGTTVQIQAKSERGAGKSPGNIGGHTGGFSSGNPLDGHRGPVSNTGSPTPPPGKGEVYNVRTDNILFICTGAFSNLHKTVLDRKAKGSMGFGASIRSSSPKLGAHETMLTGQDAAVFKKDLPFFMPPKPESQDSLSIQEDEPKEEPVNVLDHVLPSDLRQYGMIPELIGRIPTVCAVSALDEEALVRVLTEPKNSLVRQEEHKFYLDNIELRFTSGALREIARRASEMGTGARSLKHVVDRLLLPAKYEAPGSTVKHILVTREVAQLRCPPLYFHRGQSNSFQATFAAEESKWEEELRSRIDSAGHVSTFEEYRKAGAAGY